MKPTKAKSTTNPAARIAEPVQAIHAAEAELQQMTSGQLDAVVTPGRQPHLLREAHEKLRTSEAAQRALAETQIGILNALPAHIALLDGNGIIMVVNEPWRLFASANVLQSPDFAVGQNYLGVCEAAHGDCAEESQDVARGIRQVLSGAEHFVALEYPCHSPTEKRWFRLMVTPISEHPGAGAVVMHVNVTERRLAEEALRAREREQRRLAETLTVETRRLHESQAVANVGSWETNLATLEVAWTEETYRIFEVTPGEFQPSHQRFLEMVHPDDRAKVEATFANSHGRPEACAIEHRICLPGGRVKFVEARWQAFNDETGKPTRAVGTCQDITARNAVKQKLWETEERNRDIVQSALDAIISIDHEGRIIEFNPSAEKVFGWTREEVLQRELGELLIPERLQAYHRRGLATVVASESKRPASRRSELPARCADGSEILIELNLVRLGHSVPPCFTGFIRDITQQKKAELALVESQSRYRSLVESSHDLIWSFNTDGVTQFMNHASVSILGRAPEEMVGRHFQEFFPPEQLAKDLAACGEAIDNGKEEMRYLTRAYHRDGRIIDLTVNSRLTRDESGRVVGGTGNGRDVTESLRAQETLQASEARFRALFDQAAVGMCLVSTEGNFLRTNRRFCEIVGYSAEELLARNYIETTHPDDRAREAEITTRMLAGELHTSDWEKRYLHEDGRAIWCNLTLALMPGQRGEAQQFVGVVEDITERKKAELILKHANRALKMRSSCNEALVRAENEAELLAAFCRHSREIGGYRMAWVGYAREDAARTISCEARSGDDGGYLDSGQVSWDETVVTGQGPAGRVIRSGQPVICEDFETDDQFIPWREVARQRGFRSVICLPLRTGDRTFGLMALYSSEVNQPGADELKLLQEMADDLAFGIGNLRSQQERRRIEAAVRKVATSVSVSINEDFFIGLAVSGAEALDAQGAFVARLLPGEPAMARTVAAVVDGKVVENFDYALRGTPCENLTDSDECVVPADVAGQFPLSLTLAALEAQAYVGRRLVNAAGQMVGLMFVLFREPLKNSGFVVSTLRIFATRAAGEFERLDADTRIREQAALLDKATDAIIVRDLEHRVVLWSRGAEKVYGWSAAETLGRPAPEFFNSNLGLLHAAIAALMDKGEWTGELEKTTQTGRIITAACRWTLMRNESGVPESILCIETDITERKKLEAQFLRAQRMESVGTLASGIAHDMNNILSPILMSVAVLKEGTEDEATRGMLKTLESCCQRGVDLVRQLLSFARGVEGQQIAVNLTHLIRELQRMLKEVFPKDVQFEISAGRDLWTTVGDPSQLHQLFLNLCVNARDAMPRGGKLTIDMANIVLDDLAAMNPDGKTGAHVVISVTDTGTGIPPTALDKIFEPFFTTKELGKGTGLGLSTVIGIVKNHGGFVNVYSEEDQGTTFKVYLPAQTSDTQLEGVSVTHAGIPRGNGELILLVDDEKDIREVAVTTLVWFGYRVLEAANGAEAVALYVQHQKEIALVLTDVSMPIMDGAALVTALRSFNPEVRILVSSGLSSNGEVANATGSGVGHFISKPYTAEKLLGIIHTELHS